MNIMLF